jgi:hypothetical protein
MGACTLMHYLYPRLLALHDLDDTTALPQVVENEDGSTSIKVLMPSCMRDGYYFMEGGGIYLMGKRSFRQLVYLGYLPPLRQITKKQRSFGLALAHRRNY